MFYFDYTATSKPKKEILELYSKINESYWYNSETLYQEGMKVNAIVEEAKSRIRTNLNLVNNQNILFTSGATESNNTAIYGICNQHINNPKHIITSVMEHASVKNCFKDLENKGFNVDYIDVNNGIIDLNKLKSAITKDTILVSIMWVNNTMGAIEPIKDIINILKDYPRCKLHVDMVQGFSKIIPDFNLNYIDLITLSGHKLEGLKGTGLLIYKNNINLSFLHGGNQQYGIRPGTVDVAGAVCMTKTIELANKNVLDKYNDVLEKHTYLINKLKTINNIETNIAEKYSPYILSITYNSIKGETLLHMLEEKGIIVGVGSACHAHSKDLDESLLKTYKDKDKVINSIRISISYNTTYDELDYLINCLKEVY